jgi:hypothetical protein
MYLRRFPAARLAGNQQGWRQAVALAVALFAIVFTGRAFWLQEWQYLLPTPRPTGLVQPPAGTYLPDPPQLANIRNSKRPIFLHFLNAKCPCTNFNLDHVRSLYKKFHGDIEFIAVLQQDSDALLAQQEYARLHLPFPAVQDKSGKLATYYGVYSTPQAVLIDASGRLFFRGNYNRSRYCEDSQTEYARFALTHFVAGEPYTPPAEALVAYGCPLHRADRSRAERRLFR